MPRASTRQERVGCSLPRWGPGAQDVAGVKRLRNASGSPGLPCARAQAPTQEARRWAPARWRGSFTMRSRRCYDLKNWARRRGCPGTFAAPPFGPPCRSDGNPEMDEEEIPEMSGRVPSISRVENEKVRPKCLTQHPGSRHAAITPCRRRYDDAPPSKLNLSSSRASNIRNGDDWSRPRRGAVAARHARARARRRGARLRSAPLEGPQGAALRTVEYCRSL